MLYEIMYYGGMIIAIIMLIVSVLLFVKLNIIKIIGDITGITAKKTIKSMRENNEKTGTKSYMTSKINIERGTITKKIFSSDKLFKHTGKLEESNKFKKELNPKYITEELGVEETTLLENQETTVLPQEKYIASKCNFSLEVDFMIINTYEII